MNYSNLASFMMMLLLTLLLSACGGGGDGDENNQAQTGEQSHWDEMTWDKDVWN